MGRRGELTTEEYGEKWEQMEEEVTPSLPTGMTDEQGGGSGQRGARSRLQARGATGAETPMSQFASSEAEGDEGLVSSGDWNESFNRYTNDPTWMSTVHQEWKNQGGRQGTGQNLDEWISDRLWEQVLKNKGLSTIESVEKFKKLRGLRDRDANRYWEGKEGWQDDLEKGVSLGIRELSGQTRYRGGGMYGRHALKSAVNAVQSKMVDQIVQGRTEESRQAGVALDSFMAAAAEQGENALLAGDQLLSQWRMNQATKNAQTTAQNLQLFGTVLSSIITAVSVMSDERLKTVTGDTQGAAYDYLDKMETAQYDMPVRQLVGQDPHEAGVMAQSLEGSRMGQQAVGDIGGIKTIDTVQGLRSTMVAQKELHERLKQIEQRMGVDMDRMAV